MNEQFKTTIYQIITTGHWITDQVGVTLKEYKMTEPQFNVLRILRGAKGESLSVQTILDRMVQRSSNITRIVDKLLSRSFVKRQECPSNRRKVDITITKTGLEMLLKLDERVEVFLSPLKGNLTKEELATLESLIVKLKNS